MFIFYQLNVPVGNISLMNDIVNFDSNVNNSGINNSNIKSLDNICQAVI